MCGVCLSVNACVLTEGTTWLAESIPDVVLEHHNIWRARKVRGRDPSEVRNLEMDNAVTLQNRKATEIVKENL